MDFTLSPVFHPISRCSKYFEHLFDDAHKIGNSIDFTKLKFS